MNLQVYQVIHVLSVVLLTAVTFQAFASPVPERRKRALMLSGILSLLVLAGGFGAAARLNLDVLKTSWIHVKLLSWLVVSAMAGLAFRMPSLVKVFTLVTVLFVGLAVYMVYIGRY